MRIVRTTITTRRLVGVYIDPRSPRRSFEEGYKQFIDETSEEPFSLVLTPTAERLIVNSEEFRSESRGIYPEMLMNPDGPPLPDSPDHFGFWRMLYGCLVDRIPEEPGLEAAMILAGTAVIVEDDPVDDPAS